MKHLETVTMSLCHYVQGVVAGGETKCPDKWGCEIPINECPDKRGFTVKKNIIPVIEGNHWENSFVKSTKIFC